MSSDKLALLCERDGPVAVITNNDAPINRMTLEFIDALEETLPTLAQDKSVRAIVIRGAGEENFSVGMNLTQLGEGVEQKGSTQGWRGIASVRGQDGVSGKTQTRLLYRPGIGKGALNRGRPYQ